MALIAQDPNSSSSSNYNSSTNCISPSSFTSPGSRSRSFSISDILSDEVGSRKRSSSMSSENGIVSNEKQRKSDAVTSPSSLLQLGQAAGVMMSPINLPLSLPPVPINTVYPPLTYTSQNPLAFLAPHSLTPPQTLSLPVSCSPFNAQLAALTLPGSVTSSPRQVTPFRNPSLFDNNTLLGHSHIPNSTHSTGVHNGTTSENDSLDLLSAVACGRLYQSDASAASISNGRRGAGADGDASLGSRLQERMADMRLASYHAANSSSRIDCNENSETTDENSMVSRHASDAATIPGSTTPCILKRARRRHREGQEVDSLSVDATFTSPSSFNASHQLSSVQSFSHFPFKHSATSAAFPSVSFSPSIFLARPSNGSSYSHSPLNSSPVTDHDGQHVVSKQQFMTSTPIRRGGEGVAFWSPTTSVTLNSPIMAGTRRHPDSSECSNGTSSGDSEQPLLRRPSGPRRRLKARASLSPLLEKSPNIPMQPTSLAFPVRPHLSHAPPSSLLTSYTAFKPSYSQSSGMDSGIVADAHSQLLPPSVGMGSPYQQHPMMVSYFSSPHPRQKVPMSYHAIWGTSPVTDHLNRTGQIQSVPPWFICFDKKSDGKRLRLTEAINKSLQDSPKHKSNESLPPEWKKYAYGQTEDQKDLTLKARNFLRCRPRVLKFDQSKPKPSSPS